MKKISFANVKFLKSALSEESLPEISDLSGKPMIEIAIVGKSNVGKSSLINHLFNQKNLAKVSSTPGKTQTLNFFSVDDSFLLVDLPGYGYAKRAGALKETWANYLSSYFEDRKNLSMVLLLIDIRRLPSEEDISFVNWAMHYNKSIFIIFTKTDQVKESEKKAHTEACLKYIGLTVNHMHYTIKEARCRKQLMDNITTFLEECSKAKV